jgi:DNA-binding transcriptional MerR regulator
MSELKPEMLSISQFAARTRLTHKALRLYDASGLLKPRQVDSVTGYRHYSVEQLPQGRMIALLRGADLSLTAIESVLGDLAAGGSAAACARLDTLLAKVERDHRARRVVIRHVQSILRGEPDPMFEIRTRQVPARRLMSIQRRLHGDETDAFVALAKATFRAHLVHAEPSGPFTLIFHGPVNDQEDGPIEAVLAVPEEIQPTAAIGIRTEPAHTEAFTTITKRQWDYPAILAAYDAVACSEQVRSHPGSPLSCREVYIAEPDAVGDDEPICDIAYPLGDDPAS